jgi:hypothetical protein
MAVKFKWVANTSKITKKQLPKNELDRKPGDITAKSVVDMANDFTVSPEMEQIKSALADKSYNNPAPQDFSDTPTLMKLKIRLLMSALEFQRPIEFTHVKKIVLGWDSRRPATINVVYNPDTKQHYITDGQHTVLAYAIRAYLGLFKDVDPVDWLDLEINCQVVVTNDMAFCSEHFQGINGGDKLPLTPFDYWKPKVLGKRQHSPNKQTKDAYEIAFAKQTILEKYKIIPVHQDSPDRFKPGALVHVHNLDKMSVEDVAFMAKNHNTYWSQEPVDPSEMLPLQELRNRCVKAGAETDSKEFKEFMQDLNTIIKHVLGGFAELKHKTQEIFPKYHLAAFGETKSAPNDSSLSLLLKMYKKAGGDYRYAPSYLINKYSENNTDLFDHLDPAIRKMF